MGKPKDLGTLTEFFEFWHLKEVLIVAISHFIIHPKIIKFMEIAKTIVAHLTIGFILTFLSTYFMQICGGVGIAGGSVNKPIICAKV